MGRPKIKDKRVTGPDILMTRREYEMAKKIAKGRGRSLSTHLRVTSLEYRMDEEYTDYEIETLRVAGLQFNDFVHGLHILVLETGADIFKRCSPKKIVKELVLVEQAVFAVPRKTWRTDNIKPEKEAEKRKMRGIVRCTSEEFSKIRTRAKRADMSASGYVRATVFGQPVGRKLFTVMCFQMERIENNLHQMILVQEWNHEAISEAIDRLKNELQLRVKELTFGRAIAPMESTGQGVLETPEIEVVAVHEDVKSSTDSDGQYSLFT